MHCQEWFTYNLSLSFFFCKLGVKISPLLSGEFCGTALSWKMKCSVNCERLVLGKGLGLDQASSALGMPQLSGLFKGHLVTQGSWADWRFLPEMTNKDYARWPLILAQSPNVKDSFPLALPPSPVWAVFIYKVSLPPESHMWPEDSSSGLEPADKGEPSAGSSKDRRDRDQGPRGGGRRRGEIPRASCDFLWPGQTEGQDREGEKETVFVV